MAEKDTRIRSSIQTIFSRKMNMDIPSDDINLLEQGYLDSLGFVKMLSLLEEEFDIQISMEDLDIEKFKTIEQIEGFVHRKVNM